MKKEGKKEYFDASFCFMHHKRNLDEHQLTENIVFSVADGKQKPIYRKVIEFNHEYFCNLVAKKDTSYRNEFWINLCRSILNET